jgi:molecular chaperone HscB
MNYFELYEMPISLLPDQQQVKQKFYELSRKYHPDFYTRENDNEQAEALEISSQVNRAFNGRRQARHSCGKNSYSKC